MKTKWFISISLVFALFATVVKGLTVDGTASTGEYPAGQPLAVQTLGSNASAQNPTNGDIAVSSGSQLDAAYGVISNGTLYLLLAGNMQSDPSKVYDKLSIFIHTGASGQNTLANNNFDVDQPSAIRRMSFGGDLNNCAACPGLTFDTGFNAAYWIGLSYGYNTPGQDPSNSTLYVNYATLPAAGGGFGNFSGSVLPGATNSAVANGIHAAMNNSNIGGVDTNLCTTNTSSVAQSIAAATVKTGVELSISLNDIGGPAVVGPVKVTAFLSTNDYSRIYDQLLAPGTVSGCVDGFAYGDPLTNNFSTLPGTHSFTVPIAGCNYTISPFNALYDKTGGAGSFAVGILGTGGCSWTATSSVPWVVITSAPGISPVTYTVAANPAVAVRAGTITVTGVNPTGIDDYTVTQGGVALGVITVDGTAESTYGCPLTVQQIQTQFGDATSGVAVAEVGGSELDAAYGLVQNNVLFLTIAGNFEQNGNKLMVFFMTDPAHGQQTLTNVNPNANGNLNNMGLHTNNPTSFPGLTFDTGFKPNYWMQFNVFGATFFADYAQLWPGGTNSSGIATNAYGLGHNAGTNGVLIGGVNPFNIQATVNNSNTNGVDGGTCASNTISGNLESTLAATVRTGVELGIPLSALGSPTGTVAVCAFITGGDGTYMSNQILGPLGTNDPTYCQVNFGGVTNTAALNFSTLPGQHFFVVGPEVRITSIAIVNGTNVMVSYQTEANTNLTYQLQKIAPPGVYTTNSSAWANRGGLSFGTGGIITFTDTQGSPGTNKPGAFYRVRQTPTCQ